MTSKKVIVTLRHRTIRIAELNLPLHNIEEKVRPLVVAINIHYRTRMSCEGHGDRGCPYPWVDLENFQDIRPFIEILKVYNSTNSLTWVLHESHFDPEENETVRRLMPECRVHGELSQYRRDTLDPARLEKLRAMESEYISLEAFQYGAKSLAQFLDENWRKNITDHVSHFRKK